MMSKQLDEDKDPRRLVQSHKDVTTMTWFGEETLLPKSLSSVSWRHLALAGTGLAAFILASRSAYIIRRRTILRAKREAKKEHFLAVCKRLEDELAKDKTVLTKGEDIVSLGAKELRNRLRDGRLTPTEVLKAYQAKALDVNKSINCLADVILEAESWADELDQMDKSQRGPLYGMPVSVKEHYVLKGYEAHTGLSNLIGTKSSQDEVIVKVLKSLGAVPFVKTNMPQLSNSYETSNPIIGRTNNPVNPERIPGGSSGGEGALLGAGGSLLGMGSDLGGSLRVPAHFSGICSLKPTSMRISIKSHTNDALAQTVSRVILGPMTRDVESLLLITRALLCEEMYQLDRNLAPLGFREDIFHSSKKLHIGFYTDNRIFTPVSSCVRAVLEAKQALESQGHTLIPIQVNGDKLLDAICNFYIPGRSADRCARNVNNLKYDDVDPCISNLYKKMALPVPVVKVISFIMRYIFQNLYEARMWRSWTGIRSVAEWWGLGVQMQEYRDSHIAEWKDLGLDAVICPVVGYPAPPHGTTHLDAGAFSYSRMYNLLDFPAGVMPITKVTEEDISKMVEYPNHWEYEVAHKAMRGGAGLPVGIQVVSLPFQEEVCLRVMSEIESTITKDKTNLS